MGGSSATRCLDPLKPCMPSDLQVTTRSLYIEPDCVAAFIKHRRCEVISVSPLLRQLLLEAVDLPPLYDSPRDRTLIQLMLLELAAMPVREFDIPLPQHPALLALCQAFA